MVSKEEWNLYIFNSRPRVFLSLPFILSSTIYMFLAIKHTHIFMVVDNKKIADCQSLTYFMEDKVKFSRNDVITET